MGAISIRAWLRLGRDDRDHVVLKDVDFGAARRARQRLRRAGIDTRYDGRTVVIGIDAAGMPAGYRVYTIYVRERDLPVARRVTLSIQTEKFD